jgi:hypothetical protein
MWLARYHIVLVLLIHPFLAMYNGGSKGGRIVWQPLLIRALSTPPPGLTEFLSMLLPQ